MRKTMWIWAFGLGAFLGGAAGVLRAAPPVTPSALEPCAFTAEEVEAIFGLRLDRAEASDMTLPDGRDVGCLYTFLDSSFELTVRQTWGEPGSAARPAVTQGAEPLRDDPDGASWKAAPEERPGNGGELAYGQGKVQTRLRVRGGRLTGSEVRKKLLLLRRVP